MTVPNNDKALATVLRMATWALDDVARDLPAGRMTAERCAETIESLELLTQLIRERLARFTQLPDAGDRRGLK